MNTTRREFIACGAAAVGAGSVFAGAALPKVRIAAIGTGGRGHTDLHSFLRSGLCEISCAADVYAPNLEWVRNMNGGGEYTTAVWVDCNFDYWID